MKLAPAVGLSLLLGAAGGAGAHFAAGRFAPAPADAGAPQAVPAAPAVFKPIGSLLLPLSDRSGGFAGYARFELSLSMDADGQDTLEARLPEIFDRLNRVGWRTPLILDPERRTLDIDTVRRMALEASRAVLGKEAVRGVAVTKVEPA